MQGLSKEFKKYHWNVTLDAKYIAISSSMWPIFFIKVAACPFVYKFQHFSRNVLFMDFHNHLASLCQETHNTMDFEGLVF